MSTKFYFQSLIGNSIIPSFSTQWTGSSQGTRWNMYPEKGSSQMINGTLISYANNNAGSKELDRQYISPPLKGSQIISGGCSGRLMVLEGVSNDNCNQIIICLKLTNRSGTFYRATGLPLAHYGNIAEFNTSFRNKNFASGTTLTTITGQDGDRLVLEIGYGNSNNGTSPQARARWGDNMTDLPINESQSTDGAGWFSMGNVNLVFYRNSTNIMIS